MLLIALVTLALHLKYPNLRPYGEPSGSGEGGSGPVNVVSCSQREWVDVDSPDSACTSRSSRDGADLQQGSSRRLQEVSDAPWELVFSDEFARPQVERLVARRVSRVSSGTLKYR